MTLSFSLFLLRSGAIQLGETFSGVLAINNETVVAVDGVNLKIEMQTATNKVLLAELGGPMQSLAAGDTLETIVNHEIKELGQHVLACTVTYQLPPGARGPPPSSDGSTGDPNIQTFRKFYKFAVSHLHHLSYLYLLWAQRYENNKY